MDLSLSLTNREVPKFPITVSLDEESGAEIADCLESAKQLPAIRDDSTLEISIGKAAEVKALLTGIEESRQAFKKPFFKAGQAIDDFAKRCSKSLESAYGEITRRIAVYEGAKRAEREAEKRRLDEQCAAVAKAAFDAPDQKQHQELLEQARTLAIAANKVVEPVSGMSLIKSYRFEIDDLEQVWNFNRRLLKCELSHAACMDLIRVMKDAGSKEYKIPGVRVIEETKARVAGAKNGL